MKISEQRSLTIIGAGLAGSLLALYFGKRGFDVQVYERRRDPRLDSSAKTNTIVGEGRSINLALSTRGLFALEEVGLRDRVNNVVIPMKGRMLHSPTGELSFARYGKDDSEVINSVSRSGLNILLLEELSKYPNVRLQFETRCIGYNFNTSTLSLITSSSSNPVEVECTRVIGTDGSASALRTSMLGWGRFNFSQSYLEHSYKELTIPAGAHGDFQMEKNALHIWPRGGYMMIALPNPDGSFTCTLFFPHDGELSFAALDTKVKVRDFFQTQFPDAAALIGNLEESFFTNPTGNLITVKCSPWNISDQVLLLGDAAHAIVPFYGQGMNCAFEDCTLLISIMQDESLSWEHVFTRFSSARKIDADAIADLALDNFIEMRDTSANPKFLIKKKLEHLLEERYPGQFISKYGMVTFHQIPYSIAMKKGRLQDRILMEVAEKITSIDEVDLSQLFDTISAALA